MKKQQLAALCLAAGLALTGITSPVSAAQTGTGISMSANSTDTTIFPEQAVQTTQIRSEDPTDTTNPTNPSEPTDPTEPTNPSEPTDPTNPTEPSEPTDPTDPTDPTEPTEPSNPEKPDTTVKNGVCYDGDTDTWNIYKDGELAEPCNGLYDTEEGWLYIVDGKFQKDYTGLAPNGAGWWRIVDGKVDFSCNGLVDSEYGWWYLRGGRIDFEYTGLAENEYGWWYIQNGILDFSITGNYVDGIRTYNVSNGRVIGCNFYLPQTSIILPDGGYNLSTANIGLKVIKVNQAVCGNSSERYTSSTASAVKTFQRTHGLGVTGIVDITTWKAMGYSEYDWYNLGTYRTPIKVFNGATREYRINAMLQTAAEYASAGTKYKVGCSGTPGTYVDCSGLIYQCLYAAGINPASNIVDHALAIYEYTSANLAADNRLGIEVASYDLQPGDLVFYAKNGKSSVCHIAIYAGNGCIYDSWPGIGVSYRSLNISGYHTVKIRRAF